MRRLLLHVRVAAFASLLLGPLAASATPIVYAASGGSATISVTFDGNTLATVVNVPLSGYVTFDDAVPEITDLQFGISNVGPITLSPDYFGYDNVVVHSATLMPAAGYDGTGVALQAAGPPADNYAYSVGPLKATGSLSATGPAVNAILGSLFNVPFPSISGTLFVNATNLQLNLTGVTIGQYDPDANVIGDELTIKADIFFNGAVPEPGTAALLGLGLVGLLGAGRWIKR